MRNGKVRMEDHGLHLQTKLSFLDRKHERMSVISWASVRNDEAKMEDCCVGFQTSVSFPRRGLYERVLLSRFVRHSERSSSRDGGLRVCFA
jgi:hypothetical protein